LREGNHDWENWGFGMIPLGVALVVTAVLMVMKILTWKDPLAQTTGAGQAAAPAAAPQTAEAPAEAQKEENQLEPTSPLPEEGQRTSPPKFPGRSGSGSSLGDPEVVDAKKE